MSNFPIDAVITWVDGADPVLAAKRKAYGSQESFKHDDVAGATRYANDGEIYRCVASIRKFAPFIRTIFVVTDGQDPHIPEGDIPIKIVDHKDIFRGYEDKLPVFNSIAIETMTWRIPGLAEHYIEFNDDFMICSPTKPTDFFLDDGTAVFYSKKYTIPVIATTLALRRRKNGHKRISFKGLMLNGARLAGSHWRMFKLYHAPRPLNRVFIEEWFKAHPEQMERNISFRFRDAQQFNTQELFYVALWRRKKLHLVDARKYVFYFEPKTKKGYIERKMFKLHNLPWRFCCFNSLDQATEHDRKAILEWMDTTLK